MPRYAENTTVGADRSRAEIERILMRYGATGFLYGWEGNRQVLGFQVKERRIRFVLELPAKNDRQFTHTPVNRTQRTRAQAEAAWEQAVRQRWRALVLVIKAKLEAVEAGITSFEDEFLAHTLLPDGRSVGQWMAPQLQQSSATGQMPRLLPMLTSEDE